MEEVREKKKKNIGLYHFYEHIYNEFSTSTFIEAESRVGAYQGMGSWGAIT